MEESSPLLQSASRPARVLAWDTRLIPLLRPVREGRRALHGQSLRIGGAADGPHPYAHANISMAPREGVEPSTCRVEAGRSIQLSYPGTWRGQMDLNHRDDLRRVASYPLDDDRRSLLVP